MKKSDVAAFMEAVRKDGLNYGDILEWDGTLVEELESAGGLGAVWLHGIAVGQQTAREGIWYGLHLDGNERHDVDDERLEGLRVELGAKLNECNHRELHLVRAFLCGLTGR